MEIVIHPGVHFTDNELLMKSLQKDRPLLGKHGVVVPLPRQFRPLLRQTLMGMHKVEPDPMARELLLDAFLGEVRPDRLVLSNLYFYGTPPVAIRGTMLYPSAPPLMGYLRKLFPEDDLEMCIAIRNPASFLPEIFEASPQEDMLRLLGGSDPRLIRWSDSVRAMLKGAPDITYKIWCHEDTPLIWPQVLRAVAGIDNVASLKGDTAMLEQVMTEAGVASFKKYLQTHPDMNLAQRTKITEAFLERFVREDAIEGEVDVPGWTEELIEEMTEIYDADMEVLMSMNSVTFIEP